MVLLVFRGIVEQPVVVEVKMTALYCRSVSPNHMMDHRRNYYNHPTSPLLSIVVVDETMVGMGKSRHRRRRPWFLLCLLAGRCSVFVVLSGGLHKIHKRRVIRLTGPIVRIIV